MAWQISRALMEAYENSRCSQVREVAYSAGNSLDGAPSAPLSETPMPLAYLCSDRMTAFSTRSLYGMMFAPLTVDLGAGLLMWYRVVFLALTFQRRGKEQVLKENTLGSGEKWQGSFVKYDPATSLWRTHQCSLLGDWDEFSETWPNWGSMRDGECWERTTPTSLTIENEYGCWLPTPTASMWRGAASTRFKGSPAYRASFTQEWIRTSKDCAQYLHPDYAEALMGWTHKWTDLQPLETGKFQQWLRSHGKY